MLNDRTTTVLHLISVLERKAAYPGGRPGLVCWIEQQLDAGRKPQEIIQQYPQLAAGIKDDEAPWLERDQPEIDQERELLDADNKHLK